MIRECLENYLPHLLPMETKRYVRPAVAPTCAECARQDAWPVCFAHDLEDRQIRETGFHRDAFPFADHARQASLATRGERAVVWPPTYRNARPEPLLDVHLGLRPPRQAPQHMLATLQRNRLDLITKVLTRQRVNTIRDRLLRAEWQRLAISKTALEIALQQQLHSQVAELLAVALVHQAHQPDRRLPELAVCKNEVHVRLS